MHYKQHTSRKHPQHNVQRTELRTGHFSSLNFDLNDTKQVNRYTNGPVSVVEELSGQRL